MKERTASQTRNRRVFALVGLFAVQTLMALGTVFVKYSLTGATPINPLAILLYREVGAALVFLLASYRTGLPEKRDIPKFLLAAFAMFLNQSLFIVGVHLSGAVVASCIQPSQPLITFAIAVMLGRERLDWRRLTGLFSAVLGAVWVILGNAFFLESANLLLQNMFGDLCLITNCVAMAFCYIVMKDLSRTYPSVVVISWIYVFAAMYLVMLSPFMHSSMILPMSTIPLLLYLIFVCSFASYTVIAFANKQLASSQVSAFTCLQPIVGSLAAVFLLKENPSARTVAGGGLITLGLLIAVAERRRPKLAACSVIIQ